MHPDRGPRPVYKPSPSPAPARHSGVEKPKSNSSKSMGKSPGKPLGKPAAERRPAAGGRAVWWHRQRRRLTVAGVVLVALALGTAELARHLAPTGNTDQTHFDAILVLGVPADSDGNPSPMQLARVDEAVREYERGVAPHLILTGGPAHNQFVEAEVMARAAEAEGVPASAIAIEPNALDTIQNACYSVRIMRRRGWNSAEVISTPAHLPRAGMIFSQMPIHWRTHPALPIGPSLVMQWHLDSALEVVKTVRFLGWSRLTERCEP